MRRIHGAQSSADHEIVRAAAGACCGGVVAMLTHVRWRKTLALVEDRGGRHAIELAHLRGAL